MIEQDKGSSSARRGILVDRTATAVDITKTDVIKKKTAVDTILILLIEQQQQLTEQKQL